MRARRDATRTAGQVPSDQQRHLQPRMGLRNDVPNSPPRKTGNCSGTPTARKPTASYHGDLDFYFNGWDGRGRVHTIDTKKCPIYFLAGEYDWSNTPEMSEDTANKIAGARLKRMPDLDHFPATENPAVFVPYLLEAIDYVRASKAEKEVSVL